MLNLLEALITGPDLNAASHQVNKVFILDYSQDCSHKQTLSIGQLSM